MSVIYPLREHGEKQMVGDNETGMVSLPKEASKFIMQVLDENTGAPMIDVSINQDDLAFLKLLIEENVLSGSFARKAMISSVVAGESPVEKIFSSEEATRREFSRRF